MPAPIVGENTSRPEDPPRGAGDEQTPRARSTVAPLALALAALASGFLLRIPALYNSEVDFNSDEAVNALVMKHLLEGRAFSFFNWDTTYYGIVEGLLAIPFVALFGYEPIAFKLSAVVGYFLLQISVFVLGRRLFGTTAGVVAAATLAVFSPMLIVWSTMASGGFCLIAAWGTLTALHVSCLLRRPSAAKVAVLGWLLGFGVYIYQLYVVYVATFAAALALVTARELARPTGRARVRRLWGTFGAGRAGRWLLAFAGAFAVGCAPKVIAYWSGVSGSKQPSYSLAAPAVMYANAELLWRRCLPAFFGVNVFGAPELVKRTGPGFPLWAEIFYLGFFFAAWLWGVCSVLGRDRRGGGGAGGRREIRLALVLLPVVNALLFILSPNPQDTLSNRYLLPTLTSFTVLAGGMVERTGRRSRACALLLSCAVLAFGLSKSVTWLVHENYLTGGLRLVRKHEPLNDVLDLLRQSGVRGAFGDYWTAYKATLLGREEILVSSIRIWERNPEMTRAVRELPTAAYIFNASSRHDAAFRERLQDYDIPYERHLVHPYAVYLSPAGGRLERAELGPLPRFSSSVTVESAPPVLEANQSAWVNITVRNTGDSVWSAEGSDAGEYRVAASYRWLGVDGGQAVEAARTLFPRDVRPGEAAGLSMRVSAPARPGQYTLMISLVQERVAWFVDVGGGQASLPVLVTSDLN